MKLHEVDAAAKIIEEVAGPEDTIFGAVYDDSMGEKIKITVIATGFHESQYERSNLAPENALAGKNLASVSAGSDQGLRVTPDIDVARERGLDYRISLIKENLDEPAFKRRRLE